MSVCKNILVFKINIHCKYLKVTIIFKTAPHKNVNYFFYLEKLYGSGFVRPNSRSPYYLFFFFFFFCMCRIHG
jgi:hypothetical protein